MAKIDKAVAVGDIRIAIAKYGIEAGIEFCRSKYQDVHRSTFHRWCQAAQATPIAEAEALIRRKMVDVQEVLPVAPSPAIVARSPETARRNLDFLGKLQGLYDDAEALREFSMITGADGVERVKIPGILANSIKLRSDLLERYLDAVQMLFDVEQIRGFFDSIVEEVSKESPEAAARIMDRLAELNRQRGLSLSAVI